MRSHLPLATTARQATSDSGHKPEPTAESTARNSAGPGGGRPQHVHNLADIDVFPSARPGRAAVINGIGGRSARPLPPELRADMEARLGDDFSDVRIHTDEQAAESAAAFSAEAYTVGHEIVFGRGAFAPDSPEGKRRLAHELVHVRQQRLGRVTGQGTGSGVAISHPADVYEREADTVASRALAGPAPADAVPARALFVPRPSVQPTGPLVVQRQAIAAPVADPVSDPASSDTVTKGPARSNPWLGGMGGMFEPGWDSRSPPAAKAADGEVPVPDQPGPEPPAPSPSIAHPPQPVADFGVAAKAAQDANRQLLATPLAEPVPVTVPEVPTPGALEPSAGRPEPAAQPAAAEATGGTGGGLVPVELPEMVAGIAEEFFSVVETDRAGQQLLRAAVHQAVTDLRAEVARRVVRGRHRHERVATDDQRERDQGAPARPGSGGRGQGASRKGSHRAGCPGEHSPRAEEDFGAGRGRTDSQGCRDGGRAPRRRGASYCQCRRLGHRLGPGQVGRHHAPKGSGQKWSGAQQQRRARGGAGLYPSAAPGRSTGGDANRRGDQQSRRGQRDRPAGGGPQLRAEANKQVAPLIQKIRDQAGPLDASVTTAGTKFTTVLDVGTQQARSALDAATKGVMAALSQIERQSHRHLETAAGTTKAGLAQAATEGESQLRARTDDFIGEAHEQLAAHLEVVSSRPVRRELARQLSAQLRSVLQNGYGMGTAEARQVAGRIGGQLSDVLKQFHTELAGAAQTAGDESSHTGQTGAEQLAGQQRQVVDFLAKFATESLGSVDTSVSAGIEQIGQLVGTVSTGLLPLVDQTKARVDGDKARVLGDAEAKTRDLDQRMSEAMRKAQRRPSSAASGLGSWTRCVRWAGRSSPRVSGSGCWLGSWSRSSSSPRSAPASLSW